jgi:hypothetical protein
MVVEVRKTLVWATAVASVVSAMLLTSTGGGMPRIGGDASRVRATPPEAATTEAAPVHAAPRPAGSSTR